MASSWIPEVRLKESPAIASIADLETALAELAALASRCKSLDAARDTELDRIRSQCESVKVVPVGRKDIPIADRVAALTTAVVSYCEGHKAELLIDPKKKSRKLAAGEIAWRAQPAKVDFASGQTEKSVLERLESRGLTKAIQVALEAISWFGVQIGLFVIFAPKLNKSGLLAAWKAKNVTDKQLSEAGLVVNAGGELKLTIKLNEYRADRST